MLSYSLFLACVLFVSLSVELLCACTYGLSLLSLTYLLVSSVLCLVLLPLSSHYIGLLSLVSCYSAVSASPNYLPSPNSPIFNVHPPDVFLSITLACIFVFS